MGKKFIRNIVDEDAIKKLEELKVKCQCGHTMIMPVYCDSMICTFCGKRVLNNTLLHFKYKFRKVNENENKIRSK